MSLRICIRNTAFFFAIFSLRFADWDTKENRQICDLQINHYNVIQFGTRMNHPLWNNVNHLVPVPHRANRWLRQAAHRSPRTQSRRAWAAGSWWEGCSGPVCWPAQASVPAKSPYGTKRKEHFSVFRIHRIHVFFGLPDPDTLIRGMDPDPDQDPSIIMQK